MIGVGTRRTGGTEASEEVAVGREGHYGWLSLDMVKKAA